MVTLDEVRQAFSDKLFQEMDDWLLPLESALAEWPQVELSADATFYMKQGQPILVPNAPTSWLGASLYQSDRFYRCWPDSR